MNIGENILTLISNGWHIIVTLFLVAMGYAKLQSKTRENEENNKETRRMIVKVEDDAKKARYDLEERVEKRRQEDVKETRELLSEVRADIKTLLQRH
jgi:Sec-independent protein translocase protein TatA